MVSHDTAGLTNAVFIVFKARVDMTKFRDLAQLAGDRPRALLQQAMYTG